MRQRVLLLSVSLFALVSLLVTSAEAAAAADIELSGYGSFVGGIRHDQRRDSYDDYYTQDLDFKPDSLVGLQGARQLNEKASVTVQFLASGDLNWSTDVNWAYVRYQPSYGFAWKLGRLGIPFYLYSDYLSVGYSYPWISPPYHVYHVPYSNIDGADFVYSFTLQQVDIELQGYAGRSSFTPIRGIFDGMPTETRNQVGLSVEVTQDAWKFRYGYHGADLYVDTSATANGQLAAALATALSAEGYSRVAEGFVIEDDYTDFQGLAVQYDDGRYLAVFEGVQISTHDDTPAPLDRGYYLMGGVRQASFLYHLTYSVTDNKAPELAGSLPATSPSFAQVKSIERGVVEDDSAWTLGVRWDFMDNLTFKTEVTDLTDVRRHKQFHDDEGDILLLRFGIQTVF